MPAAGDHLEGVVKRAEHSAQVFARSLFRAGEVQDEAVSSRAGHGAGKHRARRDLQAVIDHRLRDRGNFALEHGAQQACSSSFGRVPSSVRRTFSISS